MFLFGCSVVLVLRSHYRALTVSLANVNLLHASTHTHTHTHTHHTLGTRNPSQSCSFALGLNTNMLCTSVGVGELVEMACTWRVSLDCLGCL